MSEILVEVIRGNLVESLHRGDICVVNSEGKVINYVGNAEKVTYFRSAAKPIILVSNIQKGIVEEFKFDLKEIAIMASSHSGGKEHIEVLQSIMDKTGITEKSLGCGIRRPFGALENKELFLSGKEATQLHNNCSAKHMGILSACIYSNLDKNNYYIIEHSIQKDILEDISMFSGVEKSKIIIGVDGCSIPVYAIPLKNIALSYCNLCDLNFSNGKYSKSQNYVVSSMTMYPEMVAGHDRIDTLLMKHFGDRLIGKMGSEGVFACGLLKERIGIAIKIEDGNIRAIDPVILELLVQLNIISAKEMDELIDFWKPKILNYKGEFVGEMKAVFKLKH